MSLGIAKLMRTLPPPPPFFSLSALFSAIGCATATFSLLFLRLCPQRFSDIERNHMVLVLAFFYLGQRIFLARWPPPPPFLISGILRSPNSWLKPNLPCSLPAFGERRCLVIFFSPPSFPSFEYDYEDWIWRFSVVIGLLPLSFFFFLNNSEGVSNTFFPFPVPGRACQRLVTLAPNSVEFFCLFSLIRRLVLLFSLFPPSLQDIVSNDPIMAAEVTDLL